VGAGGRGFPPLKIFRDVADMKSAARRARRAPRSRLTKPPGAARDVSFQQSHNHHPIGGRIDAY